MIGQMSMFDLTMSMISIENKIRLIELFAGYGSQAMTLDEMGVNYEHYKVVEFDKYAIRSYNAVHGTCFEPSDIRDIHGKDLEILYTDLFTYLLTYSFPCTDLSVAGKMQGMSKGSGTRSGLLWEVERLLTEIHENSGELPQILFMENVPQVLSSANIKDFHAWQDFLVSLGYTNHVQILNAKDYGVAQNRERAFMFSFLGEFNYKFPEPIPLTKTMKDYLEDEVPEKYYINTEKAQKLIEKLIESGDLQGCVGNVNPSGNGLNGNAYSGDLAPTLTTNKGEGPKIAEVNQIGNIAEENRFDNPQKDNMVLEKCGYVDVYNQRSLKDGICGTITANGNTSSTHCGTFGVVESVRIKQATKEGCVDSKINGIADLSFPIESVYRIRKLTERECGRLMCVSDENISRMKKVNSNSQLYKQFGNSIVVLCMVAMFSNLNIQGLPNWDGIKHKYFYPPYHI